jgi:UDP-N-acetylglucosamine 2-epimerase (non-hydrolysing)
VICHGDTNATLAAALAANSANVPLIHLEAGLRSFDRSMPEEHNRVVADHLADLCLAATDINRANLAAEGIGADKVMCIGNTIVDAVMSILPDEATRQSIVRAAGVVPGEYVVATLHRPENTDDPDILRLIMAALADLSLPVLLPMHPRTLAAADRAGINVNCGSLRTVAPEGYANFLALSAEAAVLVSDSGGVQEEASVVKRPVVVVRRSTERPEILGTFAQLVRPGQDLGPSIEQVLAQKDSIRARLLELPSPYGDGNSARRAAAAITALISR